MKLSDYAKEVIGMLLTELEANGGRAYFGQRFNYLRDEYEDHTLCDMKIEDICEIIGAELREGACSQALVLPEVAIKWMRPDTLHESDSECYMMIFNRARAMGMEMHVAKTEKIGFLTIQERIIPACDLVNEIEWDTYMAVSREVGDLAEELNIGDMHDGNWGFRPDDVNFTTPVMFDFSYDRTGRW
jgi:hypothetical protein